MRSQANPPAVDLGVAALTEWHPTWCRGEGSFSIMEIEVPRNK